MIATPKTLLGCFVAWSLWHSGESNAWSQDFAFGTLAGNAGYGDADGYTNKARFYFPQGIVADGAGNIYVADTENSALRRIDPSGLVSTLAGDAGNPGAVDGAGASALFNLPQGVAADGSGNIYVADTANSLIRRVTLSGMVSTVAGKPGVSGSSDGTNSDASFRLPGAVAVDTGGVLYIADTFNNNIRMIAPSSTNWIVTTIAGSATGAGNSDGTNSTARFNHPSGIAVDAAQNLYIADTGNNKIRRIALVGTNWITTTLAALTSPVGITLNGSILYVTASTDDTVRKLAHSGTNWVVTLLAGKSGVPGSTDGTTNAQFNYPCGISTGTNGSLYVADSLNNTVRKVTSAGVVTTLAGLAGGPDSVDGLADQARFNGPLGLAFDTETNLYVADSGNNTIRMVTPPGLVTTIAGVATNPPGSIDGAGTNAAFSSPAAVVMDQNGFLLVADQSNNQIRRLSRAGNQWSVTTVAGRSGTVFLGSITNFVGPVTNIVAGATYVSTGFSSTPQFINYSGAVTNISHKTTNVVIVISSSPFYTNVFNGKTTIIALTANSFTLSPYVTSTVFFNSSTYKNYGGVVTNGPGNVTIVITNIPFLTNVVNGKTQTNWLTANIFTLPPAPTLLNGNGTNALFFHPSGLALDNANTLYVADGGTNGVRLVAADGTVTTLAAAYGFYTVLPAQFGTNRLFYRSSAVCVDAAGTVYVADTANNTIRLISPGGTAVTIAGSPGSYGVVDGSNSVARFAAPAAIAVDSQTNLFVIDSLAHTIRKIARTGTNWVVTTIGGLANVPGNAEGIGHAARFNNPGGIALDIEGNLYIADTGNNTIRFGLPVAMNVALGISGSVNQVVVSWPATAAAAGFVLETSAAPGSGNWTTATNPSTILGDEMEITNDTTTAPAAFYRLHRP